MCLVLVFLLLYWLQIRFSGLFMPLQKHQASKWFMTHLSFHGSSIRFHSHIILLEQGMLLFVKHIHLTIEESCSLETSWLILSPHFYSEILSETKIFDAHYPGIFREKNIWHRLFFLFIKTGPELHLIMWLHCLIYSSHPRQMNLDICDIVYKHHWTKVNTV